MYCFHFHLIFCRNSYKQIVKTLIRRRFLVSDLGLHCLTMSQNWNAMLIWVKQPNTTEPVHSKIYKIMFPHWRLRTAYASGQFDQSLLSTWRIFGSLAMDYAANTLWLDCAKLRTSGWSESLLAARHFVGFAVFWLNYYFLTFEAIKETFIQAQGYKH